MPEKLQQLFSPSTGSVFVSWSGSLATLSINEKFGIIALGLTSFYTLLKIIGWFIDRLNKRKDPEP